MLFFMVSQFMKVANLICDESATISQFFSFSSRIRLVKQYLIRRVIKMLETDFLFRILNRGIKDTNK